METVIASASELAGFTVPAIKLVFTLLIGYPLAGMYRVLVRKTPSSVHHVFFTLCGLYLIYFNYGFDMIHSIITILVTYVIIVCVGGTQLSVTLAFIFNLSYLVVGYILTCTDTYDIKWTMPQCVLTLRLIGLTYDLYDGCSDPDKLSPDQRSTCLHDKPSLLEVTGYSYFFGSFLVGPQFPMRRYIDFTENKFVTDSYGSEPSCFVSALKTLALGSTYILVFAVLTPWLPTQYLYSDEYMAEPFWWKSIYINIWVKVTLMKYVGCWLLVEGSCTLSGLTYNGKDKNGNNLWNGCSNILLWRFETTVVYQDIIDAFNVNTNKWVYRYIYKRLQFMNNKNISQIATLAFLAIWHGTYSGYFMTFFNELIVMRFEKQLGSLLAQNETIQRWLKNNTFKTTARVFTKIFYFHFFLGYCFIPFSVLTVDKWWKVYTAIHYQGLIMFLSWPLIYPLAKYLLVTKKKVKDDTMNKVD